MSELSMTFVNSNSYRGFKKMVGGKVHYLGGDEQQAKVKLLSILLEQASGQKVFLGELPAKQPTNDLTLFQVMDGYQSYVRTLAISDGWKEEQCHRIKTLKRFISDTKLSDIDFDKLTRITNTIMSRPTTTRGTPMSAETAVNLLKALKQLFNWLEASDRWTPFRRWERAFSFRGKIKRHERYGPVKMLTLEEFAKAYNVASERMKCLMILALNTGMTQTELSTLTPDMVNFDESRLIRARHKTGVQGSWRLWPRTVSLLQGQMNMTKTLAFETEQGKPLVHRNSGTRSDSVQLAWARLVRKSGIRKLGFKSIRKLGGQLIREEAGLEVAQLYLAHKGSSVAEQHYTTPVYDRLDVALLNVWNKVSAALSPAEMSVVGEDVPHRKAA